jgi:hypothetical protein
MSGPTYPPGPSPGSNQIGQFQIGVSPIGDITVFNPWVSIISQYANSPILTGIILSFAAAMDPTEDFENFFDLMMNVLTAQGYGLSVWGRIVNAPRTLPVSVMGQPTFGFQEPGNDWVGFGQAPFFSGSSPTQNVTLTDSQYRPLVLAKAATNIWPGSIPAYNAILLMLFQGRGTPYVRDNGNMSITLVFPFALTALDLAVINSGVLPLPTGVVIGTSYP